MARKNVIEIIINAKDEASKKVNNVSGVVKGLGAALAAAGIYKGMQAMARGMMDAARAADQQAKAERGLATAVALAGGQVRDYLPALKEQAEAIQATTTVGDEAALSMMQLAINMGAPIEKAGEYVQAAIDMGAATDRGPEESLRQLLKTLGGYAGELGEVFPAVKDLTDEQLRQGGAIAMLASRYKGAAQDSLTFGDRVQQAANAFGDLKEKIGESLTDSEAATGLVEALKQAFIDLQGAVEDLDIGTALAEAVELTVDLGGGLAEMFAALGSDRAERVSTVLADLKYRLEQNRRVAEMTANEYRSLEETVSRAGDAWVAKMQEIDQATSLRDNIKATLDELQNGADAEANRGNIQYLQYRLQQVNADIEGSRQQLAQIEDEQNRAAVRLAELDAKKPKGPQPAAETGGTGGSGKESAEAKAFRKNTEAILQAAEERNAALISNYVERINAFREIDLRRIEEENASEAAKAQMRAVINTEADRAIHEERTRLLNEELAAFAEQQKAKTDIHREEAEKRMDAESRLAAHVGDVGAELLQIALSDSERKWEAVQDVLAREAAAQVAAQVLKMVPWPYNLVAAPIAAASAAALINSFHTGGAVPNMASSDQIARVQTGEVIVRREVVDQMGGPAAADAMLNRGGRGGGSVVFQIQTLDPTTFESELRHGELGRTWRRVMEAA